MEIPICVVDAQTLIDHIHEIKRWIYNDHLHIVVPSPTYDHVEEIFQKSKEVKPVSKEVPRPKSSGKPAKKEYPTFDINPSLAKNFLSRLKTWKAEDAASEQRDFFQEKENHRAVSFQPSNEQYTPWKDVEIEEEPQQVVEDRPTTWADALRRKQSQANGMGGNSQAFKAPAKPKLVAKAAGSESSPWKIKKDAPKISAKDVPGYLRPLMSCILWRLHEGIDRNDVNELFLLSNQTEIRTVAQKLNMNVRSTKELSVLIAAKSRTNELEVYGDLEREFNLPPKAPKLHSAGSSSRSGESSVSANSSDDLSVHKIGRIESKLSNEKLNNSVEDIASKNGYRESHEVENLKNGNTATAAKDPSVGSIEVDAKISEKPTFGANPQGISAKPNMQVSQPEGPSATGILSNAENGKDIKSPSVLIEETSNPTSEPSLPKQAIAQPQLISGNPVVPQENSPNLSDAVPVPPQVEKVVQEPEDSDEEIVVFVPQPKRFSNQKKPVQQSPRPTTPIPQSHKQANDQSPRPVSGTVQAQPKPPGRGRNPVVTNHHHPKSTGSPTVIDPDAFGRSFAVNPNPGSRILHNPRSHHRPRHSAENASFHRSNPNTHQHTLRTTAPRESPQNNSSSLLTPGRKTHQDRGPPVVEEKRASPQRRSKNTKAKEVSPQGHGPKKDDSGSQLQPKSLAIRMVESEEFVPRSAFNDSQLGAIGTQPVIPESQSSASEIANPTTQIKPKTPEPRIVDPNSFSSRNLESTTQAIPRNSESRATDSNGFVPRSAMPTMQYYRRTPEPEVVEPRTSMPEVQYVLKSGSTRAAARGRGRLWTPS